MNFRFQQYARGSVIPVVLMFFFPFDICSTRNYTVPDPPGLFDGHVWPMYLKHRKEMEDCGVDVGKPS